MENFSKPCLNSGEGDTRPFVGEVADAHNPFGSQRHDDLA
jgi:hypothetical protein